MALAHRLRARAIRKQDGDWLPRCRFAALPRPVSEPLSTDLRCHATNYRAVSALRRYLKLEIKTNYEYRS